VGRLPAGSSACRNACVPSDQAEDEAVVGRHDSEVLQRVEVVVNGDLPDALVTPLPVNSGSHPHAWLVLHIHVGGHGRPLVVRLDPVFRMLCPAWSSMICQRFQRGVSTSACEVFNDAPTRGESLARRFGGTGFRGAKGLVLSFGQGDSTASRGSRFSGSQVGGHTALAAAEPWMTTRTTFPPSPVATRSRPTRPTPAVARAARAPNRSGHAEDQHPGNSLVWPLKMLLGRHSLVR
jgi:hypothetical protein